jgi:hypothetical protein
MPNHVTNIIDFSGKQEDIDRLMSYIQAKDEPYGSFDFNKIIPMPETMNVESGGSQSDAMNVFFSAINPDSEDMGIEKVSRETFKEYLEKCKNVRRFFISEFKTNLSYEEVCQISQKYFNEKDSQFRQDSYIKDDIFLFGKTVFENIQNYGAADWYSWSCNNWGTKWNAYDYPEQDIGSTTIQFNTAWSAPHPVIQKLSEMFPTVGVHHKWADEDMGNNCGYVDYLAGEGEVCYKDNDEDHFRFAAEILGYDLGEYYEAKNGSLWCLYDVPNTVSKAMMDDWISKGFSLHGFTKKISFDETKQEYNLSGLDDEDMVKFLKRLDSKKISIEAFIYGE